MGKVLIEIRGLRKKYFDFNNIELVTALGGVKLSIFENEFFALVGPSGCGKSTLLYILAGLLKPTQGEILIDGQPIEGPSVQRGMVFQEWALLPWKSVRGNIELGLKYKKVPKEERNEIVNYLANMVGLEKFLNCYPHELSGGMKQRVGLARALANDPRVILFDEPFASVDAQTRMTLQEELLKIWAQANKTMVFVTHSVEEAVFLADRVGIMTCVPSTVKKIKQVNLPRPRTWREMQDNKTFSEIKSEVLDAVREEVMAAKKEEAPKPY